MVRLKRRALLFEMILSRAALFDTEGWCKGLDMRRWISLVSCESGVDRTEFRIISRELTLRIHRKVGKPNSLEE